MLSSRFLVVAVLSAYGEEIRGFGLGLEDRSLGFVSVWLLGFFEFLCQNICLCLSCKICSRTKAAAFS